MVDETVKSPEPVTPAPYYNGVNSSRSPDVVPRIKYGAGSANAGNQKHMNLDSCFHRKPWIPAFAE